MLICPSKLSKKKKCKSIGFAIFVVLALFIVNLHIIFSPQGIQKKFQRKIHRLFQSSTTIEGIKFDFFSHLQFPSIFVQEKGQYFFEAKNVKIYHHPWLVWCGIYYPRKTEIEELNIFIHKPNWNPQKLLLLFGRLTSYFKKQHTIKIKKVHLTLLKGHVFSQNQTYFIPQVVLLGDPLGFTIKTSKESLTSKRKKLPPWEKIELNISYKKKIKEFQIILEATNFQIHQETAHLLPKKIENFIQKTSLESIMDTQIHYTFSSFKKSSIQGFLNGYNLKIHLKKLKISKGEVELEFHQNTIKLDKFAGICNQKIFTLKGNIFLKDKKQKFIGQFLFSKSPIFTLQSRNPFFLLEKIFTLKLSEK